MLSGAKLTKIFTGLGTVLHKKLEFYSTEFGSSDSLVVSSESDVEKYYGVAAVYGFSYVWIGG